MRATMEGPPGPRRSTTEALAHREPDPAEEVGDDGSVPARGSVL
jgi:hypothetical protein